jgi:hypothetical protein
MSEAIYIYNNIILIIMLIIILILITINKNYIPMNKCKPTVSRCKRACERVCADAYGKSPHEKNPAHLPKRGEKLQLLKRRHFKVLK